MFRLRKIPFLEKNKAVLKMTATHLKIVETGQ